KEPVRGRHGGDATRAAPRGLRPSCDHEDLRHESEICGAPVACALFMQPLFSDVRVDSASDNRVASSHIDAADDAVEDVKTAPHGELLNPVEHFAARVLDEAPQRSSNTGMTST